jgi:hypothetical protein
MAITDLSIRFKLEAKTIFQRYKDQSLLQKKFGEDGVKVYNMCEKVKTASELIEKLGISEERLIEILEFMNNNGMIRVISNETEDLSFREQQDSSAQSIPDQSQGQKEEDNLGKIEKSEVSQETQKKEKIDVSSLAPIERIIYNKYGELGVQIYNLIDGEKTANDIIEQTGVSEAKLVEILEFMNEKGIIHLEKPIEYVTSTSKDIPSPEEIEEKPEPKFQPIIEEAPEGSTPVQKPPAKPKEKQEVKKEEKKIEIPEDILMVDVPSIKKLSLTQRILFSAELATKFGKEAREMMKKVDGKRDFVELALLSGLSLFDIDMIMAYFGKKGYLEFRQLNRDEINKKYGEDGFAIYKKFGRDGLLIYEMIGKEPSIKDIILKSKLDPDRAIDIILFIHQILGLDVPIDRNLIYRQLGLKK